jgi:predicted Holliday junction resolvase-like endonuclease
MVYSYIDKRTGLKELKPIGKKDQEERIIESMLARFNKELREAVYQDVIKKVSSCGKDLKLKEEIWKKIVDFREDLYKRKDKELIDRLGYSEIFQSVIVDYNLYDPSFSGV